MYCTLMLYKNKPAAIYNHSRKSYDHNGRQLTVTDIYTVFEDGAVEKDASFVQSGYYVSCRERNGKPYVITTYDGFLTHGDLFYSETDITEDIVKDRLPVSGIDEGSTIKAENILIPEEPPCPGFTVVSGLDLTTRKFNTVAEVTGMGKGEQVKSVRFYGETAYVVTFIQTDPLYAPDLSNPENPVILSELKTPGFSTYLQRFGEDMLFGFGYDAYESTGRTKGLKLNMFDISDAKNTCEKHTLLLGENTYFTDGVLKTVVVDTTRNLIMFPYRFYGNETIYDKATNTTYSVYTEKLVYVAYLYEENGFELLGR